MRLSEKRLMSWGVGVLALRLLPGCMVQPLGGETPTPAGVEPGALTAAQLDGPWRFVPDSDAIPSECYEFDAGTLVMYSSFCDEVTDLEEPAAARIDGPDFSLTFQASLFPSGATVRLEGTVIDADTIRVQMTITELGGSQQFTAPGRLIRGS